jgi:hypothetical protein
MIIFVPPPTLLHSIDHLYVSQIEYRARFIADMRHAEHWRLATIITVLNDVYLGG